MEENKILRDERRETRDERRETEGERQETTDGRQSVEKLFNNKMNILKALGMIAVVGGHCGINFLPWFPGGTFRMPLFMFISGYFFHDSTLLSFMKSKVKHLIIPLLTWNLAFGIICTILLSCDLIHFGQSLSWKTVFIDPFIHGHQFVFNLATWFVGTLVELQLLYWILYRLCRRNHFALLVVSLVCYTVAWFMADNQWQKIYSGYFLPVEKVLFMLIFYELESSPY